MQDVGRTEEKLGVGIFGMLCERAFEHARWRIEKFIDDEAYAMGTPHEIVEFEGNLMLNEGINELWKLVGGTGATKYDNSNAYLGVGDSQTAAAASQTSLQAAANKAWKGMEGGYPTTGSSQQIVFRSVFGASDANYDWEEFTVVNASSDSGENLCRKVSDQGTKANGQTWTLTYTITLS